METERVQKQMHIHTDLSFTRKGALQRVGEKMLFSINGAGTPNVHMLMKLDPFFRLYTKTNSERIIKLKVKSKSIKALENK